MSFPRNLKRTFSIMQHDNISHWTTLPCKFPHNSNFIFLFFNTGFLLLMFNLKLKFMMTQKTFKKLQKTVNKHFLRLSCGSHGK